MRKIDIPGYFIIFRAIALIWLLTFIQTCNDNYIVLSATLRYQDNSLKANVTFKMTTKNDFTACYQLKINRIHQYKERLT